MEEPVSLKRKSDTKEDKKKQENHTGIQRRRTVASMSLKRFSQSFFGKDKPVSPVHSRCIRKKLSKPCKSMELGQREGKKDRDYIMETIRVFSSVQNINDKYFSNIGDWIEYATTMLNKKELDCSHNTYHELKNLLSDIPVTLYLVEDMKEELNPSSVDAYIQIGKNILYWSHDSMVHIERYDCERFKNKEDWIEVNLKKIDLYGTDFQEVSMKISKVVHQYVVEKEYNSSTCKSYDFVWDILKGIQVLKEMELPKHEKLSL